MSFFETLRAMGLFPNQQPAQDQPAQSAPQNPYGLDDATRRMLGFQTLGNISQQLLALGQQMTPRQRADMMQNVDFTGGYQQNLYNAAQMMSAQREAQQAQLEYQRKEEARQQIADAIKKTPPGRLRDAAMYFFQSGDLAKAGELLWAQKREFDPMTGGERIVDGLGNVVGAPSLSAGGTLAPPASGGSSSSSSAPAAAGGSTSLPPPTDGGQVDQLTVNWRRLLNDPNLTPTEARTIASQGSQKGAYDKYAEIVKNREAAAKDQASQDQTNLNNNRTSAEALTKDFEASTKSYDTIIQNGQRAAAVAGQLQTNGQISAADKLATLYQFMKTLDPEGAVRDGDVAMAQSIQSFLSQWGQTISAAVNGGGSISDDVFLEMARSMSRMANDAAGRKEAKRIQMIRRAQGRQIPLDMVTDAPATPAKNMPAAPIGLGIPKAAPKREDTKVDLHPDDESFVNGWLPK